MGSRAFGDFFTIILIIFSISHSFSQSQGTLSGFIKDEKTQEPLPGVTVTLQGTDLGAISDTSGYYEIQGIPPKSYNVQASFVGYKKLTRFNVIIKSGRRTTLNLEMEEKIEELDEVVVQGNPFGKEAETPNSIQKLSTEQLSTYPGGNNDVAKVVQSLPGVSGSVGFRNDVIIRGGGPSENVYYLDGIEIPNINHFATQGSAGGPVGLLNVSFIEDVKLISSSFPARYNNALSGVLQFDQREGNPSERDANFRVGASEAAFTLEGPLVRPDSGETAKTTFITSIRRSYLQFLFDFIDLPFLPDYWDYQYKIHHKFSRQDEISLIGIGSLDQFSINVPEDVDAEQQAILEQLPVIEQWTSTIGISWKHRFDGSILRTSLSGNILNNNFKRYRDAESQDSLLFSNNSEEDENKLRVQLTRFLGDWTWESGFSAQHSRYFNETLERGNIQNAYSTELTFWQYGLYSQLTKSYFKDRLQTSFGFRSDINTFIDNGTNPLETFSPRASISYQLSDKWSVNGSMGRYYKLPPYTVLGFKNQGQGFANRNVEYIQSDHWVAGIEFLPRQSTRFTVEGFLKEYDQYPVSLSKEVSLANLGGDFSVFGNENVSSVGKGRSYGVEFLAQQKLRDNFYGLLSYTLYRSEFTGLNNDNYLPSNWDNRHLISITGGYKLPGNWEISIRQRYLGKAPYPIVNKEATERVYPDFVYDYDRLGDKRLRPVNTTDIRVDKQWNFPKWTLEFFLEVTNALGNALPSPPDYKLKTNDNGQPVQPRELIQVESTDNGTTIPTLGIVVDF